MGERARVTSVEALEAFRPALTAFAEEAAAAIMTADASAQRALQWIRNDRLPFWKREIRKRQELMVRARSNLESKRPLHPDDAASLVEQQIALDKAKRALADAEHKLAETQRWSRALDQAVEEYRGAIQPLNWFVHADLDKAQGALERMSAALEAYLALGGPGSGKPAPDAIDLDAPPDTDAANGGDA